MPKSSAEDPRLTRLTAICQRFPETTRKMHGSHASFRVRKKVFCYFLHDHHGDGIVSVCIRTARGENTEWAAHDPARFYLPAYIGPRGWIAMRLDRGRPDWGEIREFVSESYRLAAPRRLATAVPRLKPRLGGGLS